jgi:peptide/nickel transport system substrate-binding protein
MVRSSAWLLRALTLGMTAALVVAACGGTPTSSTPGGSGAPVGTGPAGTAGGPTKGGTLYMLQQSSNDQWNQIDPQRAYTGEDVAFFSATIYRSLVGYKYSRDDVESLTLVPDMATDIGRPNADASEWAFTLRDGLTWEDGSPVTCEDVKYGVSRTFANDIIAEGATYAVQYLDIPPNPATGDEDPATTPAPEEAFLSAYYGPYNKTGQDLYDKAVICDGKTITFKLNGPHPDFNFATTWAFAPVPAPGSPLGNRDCGLTYGQPGCLPVSSGPYKVESYSTGNGGKFILVRNDKYDPASDESGRKAYPDRWDVSFALDDIILDQRLIASAGDDAFAVCYCQVQPQNLPTLFADAETALPEFAGRAISGFDPYVSYLWINVQKVKNVKIRQAMMVALNREAYLTNIGGDFAGTYADGAIKPNIGQDYAPTNLYEASGVFGKAIPPAGDPELAKKLIGESGESAPALTYDFSDRPVNQRSAAIVIESLEKAGFTITPNPIASRYYATVFSAGHDFGTGGWGADWPNASTVIAPLYTDKGGWNLSHVEDKDFEAQIDANVSELDRAKQAKVWQDMNKFAVEQAWIIPTFFGKTQTIAGNAVGNLYEWAPYGSWPYGELYVKQQ